MQCICSRRMQSLPASELGWVEGHAVLYAFSHQQGLYDFPSIAGFIVVAYSAANDAIIYICGQLLCFKYRCLYPIPSHVRQTRGAQACAQICWHRLACIQLGSHDVIAFCSQCSTSPLATCAGRMTGQHADVHQAVSACTGPTSQVHNFPWWSQPLMATCT